MEGKIKKRKRNCYNKFFYHFLTIVYFVQIAIGFYYITFGTLGKNLVTVRQKEVYFLKKKLEFAGIQFLIIGPVDDLPPYTNPPRGCTT